LILATENQEKGDFRKEKSWPASIKSSKLIDVNFSTKLIKVNQTSREIADIPPSSNTLVFRLFDRIIKWLVNPLATSLHLIIQPLRDKIVAWFSSGTEEREISALNLLDIFLRRFPSHMNPIFEKAKIMIIKSLQHRSPAVTQTAARVLCSSLITKESKFSPHRNNIKRTHFVDNRWHYVFDVILYSIRRLNTQGD
jgi:hypothetical protein